METEKRREYTCYEMSDIMERMIAVNSITVPVDYGTGKSFNPVEVHMLSHIAEFPGISVSEVAREWNRTKGAVSQIVKKLETRGMVRKEKHKGNDKKVCLYITEKGAALDEAHRAYDSRNYEGFLKLMEEQVPREKIQEMFAVMETWIELSLDWIPQ